MHGVISLPDAMPYDKYASMTVKQLNFFFYVNEEKLL